MSEFAFREQACGCRGVPDGVHVAGCPKQEPPTRDAPRCENCGLRGRPIAGVCPHCGLKKDAD